MLFNSYIFILVFLPVTLIGFFVIGRIRPRFALLWLFLASLFFYGWWNPKFVSLILISAAVNYAFGIWFSSHRKSSTYVRRWTLIVGITFNIGVLCYFKYANFLVENINAITGYSFVLQNIILPIGLSFYTFIQVAYLVDIYHGKVEGYRFLDYCTFVTFFPHLIAGPIVHHQELIPQFGKSETYRLNYSNLSIGITIFFIGLFKKVAMADSIAGYANAVFNTASNGIELNFFEAWIGALAFTFQLYFDFSGYSDMAIGLARMFNIWFPLNFYSPYKAASIIDFWRSWHITLSRFFRDYLYIPLGGNRKGHVRRYINLLVTMLLVGLWHGAGWTFVLWGALHGVYLAINHLWREFTEWFGFRQSKRENRILHWAGRLITFSVVVFAWVLFRAKSMHEAIIMLRGMMGMGEISLPSFLYKLGNLGVILENYGIEFIGIFPNIISILPGRIEFLYLLIICFFYICWFMPSTQEYMENYGPALDYQEKLKDIPAKLRWQPNLSHFILIVVMASYCLGVLDNVQEFLYYQF